MKYQVCAVFDDKMDAYMQPWYAPTVGAAIRAFGQECRNSESTLFHSPTDFHLYVIAEWDSESGNFDQVAHTVIAHAEEFRRE